MSRTHKNVCTTLNYTTQFLILVLEISGCISISDFAFLFGIHIGITISAIGLSLCVIKKRKQQTKEEETW